MDLYSINTKNFKRTFILVQVASALAIIASYFTVKSGVFVVPAIGISRTITLPLLLLMFILAMWSGRKLRKRIAAMSLIEDFELKVQEYEKVYRSRLQWNLISCLILCFLFVLTTRNFFFYFSILQALLILPFYPSATLFKRELRNNEIILY